MVVKAEATDWERVLVRHVMAAKRDQVTRIEPLLRVPFPGAPVIISGDNLRDLSFIGLPSGRWMLAARFAKESWVPLFSGAADGNALFEANADGRRLEVAWIGCRPKGDGWFIRIHRAGKPIVDFKQAVSARPDREGRPAGTGPGRLEDGESGEAAFRRLCASSEISLPTRDVRATERGFLILGARGKPVKSGLRGYVFFRCPAITAGEDAASDALAEAIERCDPGGIRDAIGRGASLTLLPDTSVSPLLSALYRCGRCDPRRWKACLEVLLSSGCPIDGTPQDEPPLLGCVQHHIPIERALKMVKFLVAHGADVNAKGPRGQTALFESVVHGRTELVRFLWEHGADPHMDTEQGVSTIEWLRGRLKDPFDLGEQARYAAMLKLFTGSSAG